MAGETPLKIHKAQESYFKLRGNNIGKSVPAYRISYSFSEAADFKSDLQSELVLFGNQKENDLAEIMLSH